MNPKVSIIIPCYNSEKWIEECVMSALSQTYENVEVIVVDNESTDASVKEIKKIQEHHSELIFSTAKNIYPYSWEEPVDKALSLATGQYFTILGSDDYIEKDYVANFINIITQAPKKIMIFQSVLNTFNNTNKIKTSKIGHSYKNISELKNKLLTSCPVTTPTVVYNKSLYDDGHINWRSKDFLGACDYDLYCQLVDKGYFIYPFPKWLGYNYRWHDEQCTWGMHSEPINYDKLVQDYWRNRWK